MKKLGVALLLVSSGLACAGVVAPQKDAALTPFPTARWNALLEKNVDTEGRVSYDRVDKAEVDKLYASIAASSPTTSADYPTAKAKEAYYLNAYNVLVWKNVLDRLPKLKSVDDAKLSFFVFTKFEVGGKAISLKDLESDIIRPQFKDPRVHMALNCASAGCPALPREAFTADRLDEQLDREVRKFVGEKRNVDYDAAKKVVRISKIFDWYKDDFGKEPQKVLAWINGYRAKDAQLATDSKISYIDYDWHLNDEHLLRR
ncbi:MAG: DUF547 domain-containing protein [Polyangia bacterium]